MIGIRAQHEPPSEPRVRHPKWLIAAGGYRSGSTLQYNLVGVYLEVIGEGRRFGLVNPDDVHDLVLSSPPASVGIGIVKTHHAVAGFRPFARPTAWAEMVLAGQARAISTVRDGSSTRRSMCRKFGYLPEELESSLEWREDLANRARWRELGAIEQRYEVLVDEPVVAIAQLCEALSLPWVPDAAFEAASRTSVDKVLAIIRNVPLGQWDPLTLVHWDHIDPNRVWSPPRIPGSGSVGNSV